MPESRSSTTPDPQVPIMREESSSPQSTLQAPSSKDRPMSSSDTSTAQRPSGTPRLQAELTQQQASSLNQTLLLLEALLSERISDQVLLIRQLTLQMLTSNRWLTRKTVHLSSKDAVFKSLLDMHTGATPDCTSNYLTRY